MKMLACFIIIIIIIIIIIDMFNVASIMSVITQKMSEKMIVGLINNNKQVISGCPGRSERLLL